MVALTGELGEPPDRIAGPVAPRRAARDRPRRRWRVARCPDDVHRHPPIRALPRASPRRWSRRPRRSARPRSRTAGRSAATSRTPRRPATRCRSCWRSTPTFVLGSLRGERSVAGGGRSGPAYRQTALAADELVTRGSASRSRPGARSASARSARAARSRSARSCWRSAGATPAPRRPWTDVRAGARVRGGRRRSGHARPRPPSRAARRRPRPPTSPPRRSPPSSTRSTTSARPPSTAGSSPRASCIGSSARRAAGDHAAPAVRCRRSTVLDASPPGPSRRRWRRCSRAPRGSSAGWPMARPFGSLGRLFERGPRDRPRDARGRAARTHRRPPTARRAARRRCRPCRSSSRATHEAAEAAAQRRSRAGRVAAELDRLNAAYEARFGFRYCVFVAGRPRAALLPGMAAALDGRPRRRDRRGRSTRRRHRAPTGGDSLTSRAWRRPPMIELGPTSLRQGGHPPGPGRPRDPTPHRVRDLTVAVALEGDFVAAHTDGDNTPRRRHGHDEEHGLRVRQGSSRRLDRGLRARAGRALPRPSRRSTAPPSTCASHALAADRRGRHARARRVRPGRRGDPGRDGRRDARRDDGRGRRRGPHRHEDDPLRRSAASRATGTRRCPTPTTG